MNRAFLWPLLLCALQVRLLSAEVKLGAHTFTIPDGFEIEVVAGPPMVDRPIMADFDNDGRLYVADSAGVGDKLEKQLQDKPHRIVRLEDTDGDGQFDKSLVFADKMMFPEGILWFDGAVYCGAPPSIWKLEDTNGDGIADRRSEWFQGKTMTGCGNDVHGPYLGPDGWIYWCKGAFAKQTYVRPGLPTISDSAAHIFRCRPDGSGIDSVMSGGMDNPVEAAFGPAGDVFFTTTFYTNPEGGKRDALVHAVYGAVFPKVHGVLDGLKRTGDLMPAMTHLGPAAPSGLCRYASRVFGRDFEDNLFSTQFNLHKVQRHILAPAGGTFRTRDIDFVVSDNTDFHPTDVLEDADGSLLIIDTGGWYKLCCPTSQLAKPDILGAIYRVRRKGATKIDDPRGLKLKWDGNDLVNRLDDSRPAVRNRGIAELAKQNAVGPLTKVLSKSKSVEARRNAVWALTRIESAAARKAVRSALSDSDATVQQAAAHSVGLHRDADAAPELRQLLRSSDVHVQREAATALGRIGDKSAVARLVAAASANTDRILEHSLIYALIEIGDREQTLRGVHNSNPNGHRAALIALDQMDHGQLKASEVVPLLSSNDKVLRQTAEWISAHHSEWGGELTGLFRQRLRAPSSDAAERNELVNQLAQFARESAIQNLIADELAQGGSEQERLLLLQAMAKTSLKQAPGSWGPPLAATIKDPNDRVARTALEAVRALPAGKTNQVDFTEPLMSLARDSQRPDDLRLQAMATTRSRVTLDDALFDLMVRALNASNPPLVRINAATVASRAKLTEAQALALADNLPLLGPLELSRILSAFDGVTSEDVGLKLVAKLKECKALGGIPADALRTRFTKCPASVQKEAEPLLAQLNVDLPARKARLDEIATNLSHGDHRRGQNIFNGTKTACSTCHAVGYLGGQIGPDLTRIGSIRTERDLLEAILYPSISFARGYEPMIITTKDGEEHSGLVKRETSDSIVLVSGPVNETRLVRTDISEMRPGTVSIMPEGLDQQLSRQELADLVAFLRALK